MLRSSVQCETRDHSRDRKRHTSGARRCGSGTRGALSAGPAARGATRPTRRAHRALTKRGGSQPTRCSSAPLSAVAKRVTFPYDIWRLADVRWQDLGYRSLSAYVTGLIRYDLLVSGPHSTITADCRSKIQRALTRKTLAARRKGDRRKILLDHLIERAEGRPVTDEELEKMKAQIAETLRSISLKV